MQITGIIVAILEATGGVSQRTGNQWRKQEFVLETNESHPKKVCFEVFGEDRINQFNIQMGEVITANIEIDAHEYNGRWYNKISCFDVIRTANGAPVPRQQQSTPQQSTPQSQQQMSGARQPTQPQPFQVQKSNDDLPF